MRHRWRLVMVVLLVCFLGHIREVRGQAEADLFDSSTLHEVRLLMSVRDLQRLREQYQENTYYPADLIWRDMRVRNVAVRSRGIASRNPTKLGLLLDFGRYVDGQELLGQRSLVLDNLWLDPSMMREHLAMTMFARMGQPAPRTSFARLYINDEYQGLYGIVEAIDQPFLARTLGDLNGYLFEYHFVAPFFGTFLGEDLQSYKAYFEPRTRELESDSMLYGPIRELFREVNQADDQVWRERAGQYLDVPRFITHVAVENFLAENDGALGFAGMANFYLHRSDGTSQHRLLPWDKDSTFFQVDFPIFQRADENVMFRRAMAHRELRDLYASVLEQCARSVRESGWLRIEINRVAAMIGPSVLEDTRKQFTNDAFENQVIYLREFAVERPAFVLRELRCLSAQDPAGTASVHDRGQLRPRRHVPDVGRQARHRSSAVARSRSSKTACRRRLRSSSTCSDRAVLAPRRRGREPSTHGGDAARDRRIPRARVLRAVPRSATRAISKERCRSGGRSSTRLNSAHRRRRPHRRHDAGDVGPRSHVHAANRQHRGRCSRTTGGEKGWLGTRDPVEVQYESCYDRPSIVDGPWMAREMIARRREMRALDALEDLVQLLRGASRRAQGGHHDHRRMAALRSPTATSRKPLHRHRTRRTRAQRCPDSESRRGSANRSPAPSRIRRP